jgi:hypothetical protein
MIILSRLWVVFSIFNERAAKVRRKNTKKIQNAIANVDSFLHTRACRDVTAKFLKCAVF